MSILAELPARAADYIGEHGWVQNQMEDDAGKVCVAGAVRACANNGTDCSLTLAILRATGHGEDWNDQPERTAGQVRDYLAGAAVTDADLSRLLGPNWRHLMAVLRRAESLTAVERRLLSERSDTGEVWVARHAAQGLAGDHGRAAVAHLEVPPVGETLTDDCGAVGDALWGISTRDLIGQHGYTREDYTALTSAWVHVVGAAHPDDDVDRKGTR